MTSLLHRFTQLSQADTIDSHDAYPILPGRYADYLALKAHHYRPGNPATVSRILSVYDSTPTASERFTKTPANPRPIAVLVESLPVLSCSLRDVAMGGRYGHLPARPRSALRMQEMRCISRVIVDPRCRGMGLAVRLVRHALATAATRYTESLAVMGRVHPFHERAGMTAYERPPSRAEARALAALRYAGIDPSRLVLPDALAAQIDALAEPKRSLLIKELTAWYRTAGGRGIKR